MPVFKKILSCLLGLVVLFLVLGAIPPGQGRDEVQDAGHHEGTDAVADHKGAPGEDEEMIETKEHGTFDPGEFIFDHIADSYEWHILTYNDFHLSIPLPVIVYSREKGLNIFLFSRFEHGHEDYRGFRFDTSGPNEGKVVEVLPDGSTALPAVDVSFTKDAFAILFSLLLMLWVFVSAAKAYKRREGKAPAGLQNLVEPFIMFIRDEVAIPSIGEEKAWKFLPYLLTIFFFIWINNMLGIIPIFPAGANVTGNITVTMLLAIFTFVITTINGNREYWKDIFNMPGVPWWLKFPIPLMPIIEIVGMFTKPFVLMVRLFANISAGHIIALGFFSIIFIFGQMQVALGYTVSPLTILFTVFMSMIELLVALIQAYVFTLLSALYFGMATVEEH